MSDSVDTFRSLMQRIGEGSEDAAWELVEQFGDSIRRAVRRSLDARLRSKFDSLDFVQVVWASFFRARDRLARFDGPEQLTAFLVVVARNKVGMEMRRRLATAKYNISRERPLDGRDLEGAEMSRRQPEPMDVAIARERWNSMLVGKPNHYRQAVELRLQGHTCQEIADTLELDESTVRRCLKKMLCELSL